MKKIKSSGAAAACAVTLLVGAVPQFAGAAPVVEGSEVQTASHAPEAWHETAEVEAFPVQSEGGIRPRSGNGVALAPGGFGSTVTLHVRGGGLHVDSAEVIYTPAKKPGTGPNVCGVQAELSYFTPDGRRHEFVTGTNCGFVTARHTWRVDRNLKADSPICGRVQVDGNWSSYACVTIRR